MLKSILSFSESCIHPLTIVSSCLPTSCTNWVTYSGLRVNFSEASDKAAIKKSEVR